jgi:hypothetical protein
MIADAKDVPIWMGGIEMELEKTSKSIIFPLQNSFCYVIE